LIYPLNQVRDSQTVQQILDSVAEHLTGPIGIRRYNGDSYWCNDYRQQFTAELRSSDFSEDISNRDRLLRPGLEAQWCLFDPIVACIYGRRYEQTGESVDLARQDPQRHHAPALDSGESDSSSRFAPAKLQAQG
jgi:phosphorylase kinase alpha/beta subunit